MQMRFILYKLAALYFPFVKSLFHDDIFHIIHSNRSNSSRNQWMEYYAIAEN